jgi:hypothetical protein
VKKIFKKGNKCNIYREGERKREGRDIGGVRDIFAVKGRREKSLEKKVYIVRKVGRHVGR